jgi:hypothetical protein
MIILNAIIINISLASHAVHTTSLCVITHLCVCMRFSLLLQSALQPLVGFRLAQPSLSILSRKVLQSAVVSGTSNPQLGGQPGI